MAALLARIAWLMKLTVLVGEAGDTTVRGALFFGCQVMCPKNLCE